MIDQQLVDDVSVVAMCNGENRFNLASVTALTAAVEAAAQRAKPLVLVGEGKFFSNGLDLDWLGSAPADESAQLFPALYELLAKILGFPGATVAAINGHAFGGGLILSSVTDYRVMRADRGYLCFPEVDLDMAMSDEFDAIIQAKFPADALLHALITGHRYTGPEAKAAGLVHEVADEASLLDTAIGMAREFADKNGSTVGRIKAKHYQRVIATLRSSAT